MMTFHFLMEKAMTFDDPQAAAKDLAARIHGIRDSL